MKSEKKLFSDQNDGNERKRYSDITFEDVEAMTDEEIANLTAEDHLELAYLRKQKKINESKTGNTTAQDLRTQVLSNSLAMIERLQQSFVLNEPLTASELAAYDYLWPIIENLINKTEDLKVLKAKNASDVISAVAKGKMSVKDAASMMSLLQVKFEMEELSDLLDKMDDLEKK